jgi:hypothetical protein
MHDNYGRWLEATLGDRAEELREVVAYHAERAYLYAAELGRASAPELGSRALALLMAAAERAREHFDMQAASKLYGRAAAIADAIDADLIVRAEARGYAVLGRFYLTENVDRTFEEAMAFARAAGANRVLVKLLWERARNAFDRDGDTETALKIANELPDLARAIGDDDVLAETLVGCGLLAYWTNDRSREVKRYLEAVEVARRTSRTLWLRIALQRLRNRAVRMAGDFSRATEYERELAAVPVGSSRLERCSVALEDCVWRYTIGDFLASRDSGETAYALAREFGTPRRIARAEWFLGQALLDGGGDVTRARQLLEQGGRRFEGIGSRVQIPELLARAAIACLRLGDRRAARAHIAASNAALVPLDIESHRITAQAEALLRAADGDIAGAERIARDELARIEPSGYGFEVAQLRIALGEILLVARRGDEARREFAKARAFFADPLAHGWQKNIDALVARCEATVSQP